MDVNKNWNPRPVDLVFTQGLELKRRGKCPTCSNDIDPDAFRNDLERKEYSISGMCHECQREVFG